MLTKISLSEKLALFSDHWSPKVVADLNDSHVKLAKVKGEFVWHSHEHEDELFFVIAGQLIIELRDGAVTLDPGEFVVVPKGVEHRPVAAKEVHLMLIEPKAILHTGGVDDPRRVEEWEHL